VVYASTTIALACLETVVHVAGLPVRRWLVAIDVPEVHWQERTDLAPEDLPGWDAKPAGAASSGWGDRWLTSHSTLLATVPSVIVPPGLSNPCLSASSTIRRAMRSLMLLPGLNVSTFA
jgi:RES domain-containing protein